MTEEKKEKKSLNPVADRVEKRTKEISVKSEKLVSEGLNFLENFILKLPLINIVDKKLGF